MSGDQAFLQVRIEEGIGSLPAVLGAVLQQQEDRTFVATCEQAYSRAADGLRKRFWADEGYRFRDGSAGIAPEAVYSPDQLIGQWISDQLDLGPLLPPAEMQRRCIPCKPAVRRRKAPERPGFHLPSSPRIAMPS